MPTFPGKAPSKPRMDQGLRTRVPKSKMPGAGGSMPGVLSMNHTATPAVEQKTLTVPKARKMNG